MKTKRVFAIVVVVALAFVMVPAHAARLTAVYNVQGTVSYSVRGCDLPCVPGATYTGSGTLTRRVIPVDPVHPADPFKGTWSFSGVSSPPS